MAIDHPIFGASPLAKYSLSHHAEWGDHLSVEHPSVDAQHKVIFEHVDEVHALCRHNASLVALRAAVDQLNRTLETHFRYEERMLAETPYPRLAEHAAQHRALLDQLAAIRESLAGDGTVSPDSGRDLLDFLLAATVGHIVDSDIEYRRYVAANPVDELDVSITNMTI